VSAGKGPVAASCAEAASMAEPKAPKAHRLTERQRRSVPCPTCGAAVRPGALEPVTDKHGAVL